MSRDVYRRLGNAAAEAVRAAGGVVVDGTFRRVADRRAFLEAFDEDPQVLLWVQRTAAPDVLLRRAEARAADPHAVSDATVEIVRQQLRHPDARSDAPPGRRLRLDTDQPLEATFDQLRGELDATLGVPV